MYPDREVQSYLINRLRFSPKKPVAQAFMNCRQFFPKDEDLTISLRSLGKPFAESLADFFDTDLCELCNTNVVTRPNSVHVRALLYVRSLLINTIDCPTLPMNRRLSYALDGQRLNILIRDQVRTNTPLWMPARLVEVERNMYYVTMEADEKGFMISPLSPFLANSHDLAQLRCKPDRFRLYWAAASAQTQVSEREARMLIMRSLASH